MRTKLTKTGNGLALVLDKPLLDQVGIDARTPLEVPPDGHVVVISPVRKGRRTARMKTLVAQAHRKAMRGRGAHSRAICRPPPAGAEWLRAENAAQGACPREAD